MEYSEFIDKIKKFEDAYWFGEIIYFKAIELLQQVRTDPNKLEKEHVTDIIKPFLINWGRMGRTVERDDTDWVALTQKLQSCAACFQRLSGKSLLDINLNGEQTSSDIKAAYNSLHLRNIGRTAVSKILHLFNPELFVMWDDAIYQLYKSRFRRGKHIYLEFLRIVKEELDKMLGNQAKITGQSKGQIADLICSQLPSRKLGPGMARKSLAKLVDEYNWWVANKCITPQ